MEKCEKIWLDGKLVDWNDAKVHVLAHALNYGTGVFEGIRVYQTPKGPAIFRLKDHARRLVDGCKMMGFDMNINGKEYDLDAEAKERMLEHIRTHKRRKALIESIEKNAQA